MSPVRLCALWLCLSGCTLTFDGTAPGLPEVGQPLDLSGLPRWNKGIATSDSILTGVDGATWAAVVEQGPKVRLHRVTPPEREEVLPPMTPTVDMGMQAQIVLGSQTVFVIRRGEMDTDPTKVQVHRVGGAGPDQILTLPPGPPLLLAGGTGDSVLLYWGLAKANQHMQLIRLDRTFTRDLPLPAGVDPTHLSNSPQLLISFDGSGDHLFVRDGTGHMTVYSTASPDQADLDDLSGMGLVLDEDRKALLATSPAGLLRIPYDPPRPAGPQVLDPAPYLPQGGLWLDGGTGYYISGVAGDDPAGHTVQRVALDGNSAPQVVLHAPAQQLLRVLPSGDVIYSRDAAGRFINNASDGWLGDWQFMQRGRLLTLSDDGKRLRFLEDAAQIGGSGDLISVPVAGGTPLMLLRNAHQYRELSDGRVLAVDDYAFRGPQNRLVLVDEQARVVQLVAQSVAGFDLLPGSGDVLLRVVTGLTGFDVVRISLPPPP